MTVREDYAHQITRVNTIVNNLAEIQNNLEYTDEEGEKNDENSGEKDDGKNDEVRNKSREDNNLPYYMSSKMLENKVNRIVTNKFDELRKDQSALNKDSDVNSLTKMVKESLKFEIVNKSMNVK